MKIDCYETLDNDDTLEEPGKYVMLIAYLDNGSNIRLIVDLEEDVPEIRVRVDEMPVFKTTIQEHIDEARPALSPQDD